MDNADIHDLIGEIYEAPVNPWRWDRVVQRLKDATGSSFGHLWLGHISDDISDFVSSRENYLSFENDNHSFLEIASIGSQFRFSNITDPHLLNINRAPEGRAVLGCELVPLKDFKRSSFYNEFARKIGIAQCLLTLMLRQDGDVRTISFYRSARDPLFSNTDKRLLDVFIPHIRRSLNLHGLLRAANARAALLQDSIDALRSAIVLISQTGKVVFLNKAAECLIARCPQLRMRGSRLLATDHADAMKLEQLTKMVTGANGLRPWGGAVTIARALGAHALQIAAAPVPMEYRAMLGGGPEPVALLVIHDPSERTPIPHEIVRAMFGLTPAEAQLLLALSEGQTLEQYSEQNGVSKNTARTHLRGVFAKTKTSRQSELVRLMAGLTHSVHLPE